MVARYNTSWKETKEQGGESVDEMRKNEIECNIVELHVTK